MPDSDQFTDPFYLSYEEALALRPLAEFIISSTGGWKPSNDDRARETALRDLMRTNQALHDEVADLKQRLRDEGNKS